MGGSYLGKGSLTECTKVLSSMYVAIKTYDSSLSSRNDTNENKIIQYLSRGHLNLPVSVASASYSLLCEIRT